MNIEQIYNRMTFVLSKEELDRVRVFQDVDGIVVLQIDLHLMNRFSVRKLIDKTITMIRCPFRLDLIHGFNRGQVLKNLIEYEYENDRVVDIYTPSYNPGETVLEVA